MGAVSVEMDELSEVACYAADDEGEDVVSFVEDNTPTGGAVASYPVQVHAHPEMPAEELARRLHRIAWAITHRPGFYIGAADVQGRADALVRA